MAEIRKAVCDNPNCKNEGILENRPRTTVPDDWYRIRIDHQGRGKVDDVVACSPACVPHAAESYWSMEKWRQ